MKNLLFIFLIMVMVVEVQAQQRTAAEIIKPEVADNYII